MAPHPTPMFWERWQVVQEAYNFADFDDGAPRSRPLLQHQQPQQLAGTKRRASTLPRCT